MKPTASQDDINKAYRKRSKQLHPDKVKRAFIANNSRDKSSKKNNKNKKPSVHVSKGPSDRQIANAVKEANERSTRLNLAANILRGPSRERYDHFLKYGFPKWKGTGYYYSRFRPGLGSVLLGLFVVFGGFGHYIGLVLSYRRQREFMGRYIRHARKAAWGDERGLGGIPGLDAAAAAAPAPAPAPEPEEAPAAAMNRRQKRMMDRENRKENKKGSKKDASGAGSGTATPTGEPTTPGLVGAVGTKRRVHAENGKILVVDSAGNVFLEEENEDGEAQEFLLDVDEIPRPKIRDTVVFRLPVWLYRRTAEKLLGKDSSKLDDEDAQEAEEEEEYVQVEVEEKQATSTATSSSSNTKKRGKRNQRK